MVRRKLPARPVTKPTFRWAGCCIPGLMASRRTIRTKAWRPVQGLSKLGIVQTVLPSDARRLSPVGPKAWSSRRHYTWAPQCPPTPTVTDPDLRQPDLCSRPKVAYELWSIFPVREPTGHGFYIRTLVGPRMWPPRRTLCPPSIWSQYPY